MTQKYAWVSYGQGGVAFDPPSGERQLVARLQKAGVNTQHSPYQWSDINTIAHEAITKPSGTAKIVIGGDSLGANEAPAVARLMKGHRNVDLLFGFQPSVWGQHIQVPDNVIDAWCIYNPNWLETMGLGAYPWSPEPGNHKTRMHMIPIHAPHPDDWGQAQDIIFKAIMHL